MKKTKFDFVAQLNPNRALFIPTIVAAWGNDCTFNGFSVEVHWLVWGCAMFVDFGDK